MPRRHYRDVPGMVYHLILRGNNRDFVFGTDREKTHFLFQVASEKGVAGFELYGYVIMSNHYHLILRTGEKPLYKVMHRINLGFSRHYNLIHGRTGHVFEGPYTGIPVRNEGHLLSLVRYVHQNPVKAGLCGTTDGYGWSSDGAYRAALRGERSPWGALVDTEAVVRSLRFHRGGAAMVYAKAMADLRDDREVYEDTLFIDGVRDRDGAREGTDSTSVWDDARHGNLDAE